MQTTRGHEETPVFVSVVWGVDGPRFVVTATTEEDCLRRIARYVAEQARWQLWPPIAGRVAALLEGGDQAGAIIEYFRHVGERWDAERLTTARLELDPVSGVWSASPPLSVSRSRSFLAQANSAAWSARTRGTAAAQPPVPSSLQNTKPPLQLCTGPGDGYLDVYMYRR